MEPEHLRGFEEESLSLSPDLQGTRGLPVEVEEAQDGEKVSEKQQQCFVEGNLAPLCVEPGEDLTFVEVGNYGLVDICVSQVPTFDEVSLIELLPMGCCDTTMLNTSGDLIVFSPD